MKQRFGAIQLERGDTDICLISLHVGGATSSLPTRPQSETPVTAWSSQCSYSLTMRQIIFTDDNGHLGFDRQTDTTRRKAGHIGRIKHQKLELLEIQCSQSENGTLQQCWPGVARLPYHHQYRGQCLMSMPAGCLAETKPVSKITRLHSRSPRWLRLCEVLVVDVDPILFFVYMPSNLLWHCSS